MDSVVKTKKRIHGLGKIAFPFRFMGYYFTGFIVLFTQHQRGEASWFANIFLVLAFTMPFVALGVYAWRNCNEKIEHWFLLGDTFMAACFSNIISFTYFPSVAFLSMCAANNMGLNGNRQFINSLFSMLIGFLVAHLCNGFRIQNDFSWEVSIVTTVLIVIYNNFYAFANFKSIRLLKKAHQEMNEQKEKIEMQNRTLEKTSLELKAAMSEVARENKRTTNSLNYAKRIQEAMLPKIEQIQEKIPESFVFFKPRDIVSGDFYWFHHIHEKNHDLSIISAIDCTGHGVPGAFMSMIGNDLLNHIIVQNNISDPVQILNSLHWGVSSVLRQKETENRDGMDIAICVIDQKNKVLEFAGANNPLVVFQNNSMQFIKGNANPVGGLWNKSKERHFDKRKIDISIPTTCYIFSDGYQDQFGGVNQRKFMVRRFRELLLNIHQEKMLVQKYILEQTLENWIGKDGEQIDDILVIGFKI
ncbi:MAG: hypothetical protein EAZ97_01050 [Bacteroidetes bacterium]|nr:MAG: hypothetical protein EAZ97_01050 [Bacteroidota bacterium]